MSTIPRVRDVLNQTVENLLLTSLQGAANVLEDYFILKGKKNDVGVKGDKMRENGTIARVENVYVGNELLTLQFDVTLVPVR